jgi:hypothetical protein
MAIVYPKETFAILHEYAEIAKLPERCDVHDPAWRPITTEVITFEQFMAYRAKREKLYARYIPIPGE